MLIFDVFYGVVVAVEELPFVLAVPLPFPVAEGEVPGVETVVGRLPVTLVTIAGKVAPGLELLLVLDIEEVDELETEHAAPPKNVPKLIPPGPGLHKVF